MRPPSVRSSSTLAQLRGWAFFFHGPETASKHIDVRPNWKEQPPRESLAGKQWR
jgi:hypothetical protein